MKSRSPGGPASGSAWNRRLLGHAAFLAESALEPDLFRSFASRLHRDFRHAIGILVYRPDGVPSGEAAFVGPVQGTEATYLEYFATKNPYPQVVRRLRLENRTVVFSDWYPLAEWHRTEYFNDFVKKNRGDYFLALSVSMTGVGRTSITVTRDDADGGDFGPDDARRLDGLRPFVKNAVLVRSLWRESGKAGGTGPESLERPSLLIRPGGPPRPLNAAAEKVLRTIGARRAAEAASRGLRFEATAFPGLAPSSRSPGATVAVLAGSEAPELEEGAVLGPVFGLTPAQTRVATDLIAGFSSQEIASRHGITVNTVGTHIKAIHHKVGIQSSRQLLGVLLRIRRSTPRL